MPTPVSIPSAGESPEPIRPEARSPGRPLRCVVAGGQMGSPCLPRIPAALGAWHTYSPAGQIHILAKMLDAVTKGKFEKQQEKSKS